MPHAAVNGIEIFYQDRGAGRPLMMIVGLSGAGAGWGPQIPLFSKDFRTIIPDHRGVGRSSAPPGGYTVEQLASDMAEVLRSLGAGPAHIIGSSTGGAVGQVMALDHPDVVRSLTLVSSWGKTDDYIRRCFGVRKQILLEMGRRAYVQSSSLFLWSARYIRERYDAVLEWEEAALSAPADEAIMTKRIDMIIAHDQLSRLARVDKPALVVVGAQDVCTPPYFSEELARAIPGAELAVLEGGHFFYKETPAPFHERVTQFLNRH